MNTMIIDKRIQWTYLLLIISARSMCQQSLLLHGINCTRFQTMRPSRWGGLIHTRCSYTHSFQNQDHYPHRRSKCLPMANPLEGYLCTHISRQWQQIEDGNAGQEGGDELDGEYRWTWNSALVNAEKVYVTVDVEAGTSGVWLYYHWWNVRSPSIMCGCRHVTSFHFLPPTMITVIAYEQSAISKSIRHKQSHPKITSTRCQGFFFSPSTHRVLRVSIGSSPSSHLHVLVGWTGLARDPFTWVLEGFVIE